MYTLFYTALTIFWILDIVNLPFMEMFDTTYPINTLVWFLIWMFVPSTSVVYEKSKRDNND
jgi:hypothetical protein